MAASHQHANCSDALTKLDERCGDSMTATNDEGQRPQIITTHDAVTARLTEQWVDPAEKLAQEGRARKHLRLFQLKKYVTEMQREIVILEQELSSPLI
jgi:hypothetical protein